MWKCEKNITNKYYTLSSSIHFVFLLQFYSIHLKEIDNFLLALLSREKNLQDGESTRRKR